MASSKRVHARAYRAQSPQGALDASSVYGFTSLPYRLTSHSDACSSGGLKLGVAWQSCKQREQRSEVNSKSSFVGQ